ncbi:MAG TPA: hydrogenase maturation nickel metallochaperone HypA [Ktedonobacterales bacterium]|jgi:Zn finger protein HypA/HybF involved in hydrogenase expression|nr:hydrogenase maturation nickel metallochaperone HypA [Ktedonobacterales bacterium]
MHERAVIEGAIVTALHRLDALGDPPVKGVDMVVGVSGHMTEDVLRQQFAISAAGTPLEQATLRIFWVPAQYQCFDCLSQFNSATPPEDVRCPACGGIALEIEHNDQCYISALDIGSLSE